MTHRQFFSVIVVPLLVVVLLLISVSVAASASVTLAPTKVQGLVKRVAATQQTAIPMRRLRIERLLMSLDKAAAVALQMHPQNSDRVEPLIVDLAEQVLNLVGSSEIQNVKTDAELDRLEITVGELVHAMNRMIEPEMSL